MSSHDWKLCFVYAGVSYFVYNEIIDVYSEADPMQQEFIEAGVDYINSIADMATALPIYKLYRNKTYRKYEKILRRVQKAGEVMQYTWPYMCHGSESPLTQ